MSEQGTNNNEEHSSDDALNGQNPLFVIAVFLFIAGVGFFVGMDALREYRLQIDAFERFVPVEAKILRAEIAVRRNNNTNRNSYHPAIRYAYAVDGKVYKSRTYSYFQGNRGARSKAEAIVAALPSMPASPPMLTQVTLSARFWTISAPRMLGRSWPSSPHSSVSCSSSAR